MCIRDRLYALFRLFVKHRLSEKKVAPEKWQEKSAFEESVMLKNSSEKILNSENGGDRTLSLIHILNGTEPLRQHFLKQNI